MVDRDGPSDDDLDAKLGMDRTPRDGDCAFDKVRSQETELTSAESTLTLATTATTAPATTSASTSVPMTTTSKSTLDAQDIRADIRD